MSGVLPYAVGADECHQNYDETAAAARPWVTGPLPQPREEKVKHEGVACDACLECPIVGVRHKCLLCPGADFCAACLEVGRHPPDHPTLALRVSLHADNCAWDRALSRLTFPAGLALRGLGGAPPSAAAQALYDELGAVAERHVLAPAGLSTAAAYRRCLLQQRAEVRAAVGAGGRAALLEPELFTPVLTRGVELPDAPPRACGVTPASVFPARLPPRQFGTVYRPRHDALCLVSLADGLPVAALQLLPLNASGAEAGRAALLPLLGGAGGAAPPAHVFEGLLSADGAHLGLALTNLCSSGSLCVELTRVELAADWRVAAAAPLRLNAANVLRAGESLAVQADAADGRALLLRALRDAAGAPVAVAANLDAGQRKRGAHLRLRVTPQAGHPFLAKRLAAGVRWAVLDMFVRDPPPMLVPVWNAGNSTGGGFGFGGGGLFGSGGGVFSSSAASTFGSPAAFGASSAPFGGAAPTFGAAPAGFAAPAPAGFAAAAPALGAAQGFGTARAFGGGAAFPAAAAAPASSFFGSSPAAAAARAAAAAALPTAVAEGAAAAAVPMALSAAIATLEPGAPVPPQPIAPAPAGLTWDAAHAAEAIVGLAVQPALSGAALEPCAAGLEARAGELLTALERGSAARELLASLSAVHVSAECVACLESAPPPDTVFAPCGHQCMHWEEAARVERCPLCRRFISGRLCVADGRFVAAPTRPARRFSTRPPFAAEHMAAFAKPVVYLYPPEGAALPMDAAVTVRLSGGAESRFTALVPSATSVAGDDVASWRVRVLSRAGLLEVAPPAGAPPPPPVASLFWEADTPRAPLRLEAPGCVSVPGATLGDWLLHQLRSMGLTPREYTEMASYWAARLGRHAWVALRFLSAAEIDAHVARLDVQPAPDATLRVYLVCRGVEAPPHWAPRAPPAERAPPPAGADMDAAGVPRAGFTVVEWGGSEV